MHIPSLRSVLLLANERISDTKIATDSLGFRKGLWNLKYQQSRTDGVKCTENVIKVSYAFLPSFAGVGKFPSNLYVAGPITDKNTALFFSASSIQLVKHST